jgi:hypothetical protein
MVDHGVNQMELTLDLYSRFTQNGLPYDEWIRFGCDLGRVPWTPYEIPRRFWASCTEVNTEFSTIRYGVRGSPIPETRFESMVASASGVQLTGAAAVSGPYVFDGTGGASIDSGFAISPDSFPKTGFAGSDTEFTFASVGVDLRRAVGLGPITYQVDSKAPAGDVPLACAMRVTYRVGKTVDISANSKCGLALRSRVKWVQEPRMH